METHHPEHDQHQDRDWYSVSVDTLKVWGSVLVLLVLAVGGWFGYRMWEGQDLERRADVVIAEARSLRERLGALEPPEGFERERRIAGDDLEAAETAFEAADWSVAFTRGRASRDRYQTLLDATENPYGGTGDAQFVSVQGGVEFRRGESGEWQEARPRLQLFTGDHVKTSGNGSAEILFNREGTLYTARPSTQLIITRRSRLAGAASEQSIDMEYGWVDLSTNRRGGRVTTPGAEAEVSGDSEATVTYDAGSRTGRFASYRGGLEVVSGDERRTVAQMEQVLQSGDRLGEPEPLPPAPEALGPAENTTVTLGRDERLVLEWEAVEEATGYALQVSRNDLFVDNVIDVTDRRTTRATLGVRGPGSFLWRVAAVGSGDVRGPWSRERTFRVTSSGEGAVDDDTEPPIITLDEIRPYGSIFIVSGRTEPGALVEINGEPVLVEADGSFRKTIQITREGWNLVEVRARDAAGNEALTTHRVFADIF